MSGLFFYPRIDEALVKKASIECSSYELSYPVETDGRRDWRHLDYDPSKRRPGVSDPEDVWRASRNGMLVEKQVYINNPSALYGPSGVAPQGSMLGLAIFWTNGDIPTTGVIRPTRTTVGPSGGLVFQFVHEFAPGELDASLSLDLALYLDCPSPHVYRGDEGLNNTRGVSLGSVEPPVELDLKNRYMEFPIKDVEEPGGPLWRVEFYDWTDPCTDPFSEESLTLFLNSKHRDYPFKDGEVTNPAVLAEVLAGAYFLVFEKAREVSLDSWECVKTGSDAERGSIAGVLHWFSEQSDSGFVWESLEGRMESVKRIIDMSMGEV